MCFFIYIKYFLETHKIILKKEKMFAKVLGKSKEIYYYNIGTIIKYIEISKRI